MMLYLKKRLSKSGLSVSLFHHTAVLILLTHCCAGQFQVVGPFQPVIVTIGEDVILPCHLKPTVDAVGMTIEWARLDLSPRFVHVWHQRKDLHVNQHPSYKGRTSMSINRLQHGDISLTLTKVKISDNGIYRCYLPESEKDSTVQLVVGIASSLVINLAGIDRSSSGVVLHCESKGWYPEPEVFWLDGEGNLLSAGPTETVRGPDDLYTVSRRLSVEKSDNFTCRVQQKNIKQTRETHFYVPADPLSSSSSIPKNYAIMIGVLAVLLAISVVCHFFFYCKSKCTGGAGGSKPAGDPPTRPREETSVLRCASELQIVATIMEQKIETAAFREELLTKLGETKEEKLENNEKLQSVEDRLENGAGNTDMELLKEKRRLLETKWRLDNRQKDIEKVLLYTDKLLQKIDNVTDTMRGQ